MEQDPRNVTARRAKTPMLEVVRRCHRRSSFGVSSKQDEVTTKFLLVFLWFPFAYDCAFLAFLGRTLSHFQVVPFDLDSFSGSLLGHDWIRIVSGL
jgi:hypothetical protein